MRQQMIACTVAATVVMFVGRATADPGNGKGNGPKTPDKSKHEDAITVQLGPRPYYLVNKMTDGPLKQELLQCVDGPFHKTAFSIGHRGGGTLQFPEHTQESHQAGARMGAGIQECDVTFTKDGELVCRHDECDLHTTTNIVDTSLAGKCTTPFQAATFDAAGNLLTPASALCCTSDLTLAEFKTLKGKMDASNPRAKTAKEFLGGTPNWRTDLYSTGGTLLTHKESIELIRSLGSKFTPERKALNPAAKTKISDTPLGTEEGFAQKMIDEYKAANVPPKDVFAQSFQIADILYWIKNEPAFGKQAVFLDDANVPSELPTAADLQSYYAQGIRIWAPPMWALLTVENGKIVPSQAAKNAKAAKLDIITWTLERSGRIVEEVLPTKGTASPSFYFQTTLDALHNDGDIYTTLDVLAQQVGIRGIFSDWAATVTYYANCTGLE